MSHVRKSHLAINHAAPVPMGYTNAMAMAALLREDGRLGWPQIAYIMKCYHGFDRCAGWWSRQLRSRDMVPARPRGNGISNLRPPAAESGLRLYLAGVCDGPGGRSL